MTFTSIYQSAPIMLSVWATFICKLSIIYVLCINIYYSLFKVLLKNNIFCIELKLLVLKKSLHINNIVIDSIEAMN